MNIATEVQARHVFKGDQIISPISGDKLLVRSTSVGPFGMIDINALNPDGDYVNLTLDSRDLVKVLEEA